MSGRMIGFIHDYNESTNAKRTVELPLDFRHACCSGMTGSGKTVSVILPILEDRIARGHGILFYAYKGNEHAKVKALAKKYDRLEEVVEFGKPHGLYINLMEMFDLPKIREVALDLCGGKNDMRDPYWPQSAANYAEVIAERLRAIHRLRGVLVKMLGDAASQHFDFPVDTETTDDEGTVSRETVRSVYDLSDRAPSFADIYRLVSDPERLNAFFAGTGKLVEKMEELLPLLGSGVDEGKYAEADFREYVTGLVHLKKAAGRSGTPKFSTDPAEASGNDGVRQVLENGLKNISARDYANRGGADLLAEGKIIIVDIEGIDREVHGVLLELILTRLAARTRQGKDPEPFSVFIDEANRVLSDGADLYNDVLRESRVELLVAYQNDEQMRIRFGPERWESMQSNFRHRFAMEGNHVLTVFREDELTERFVPSPVSFEDGELEEAEYEFNETGSVRGVIERNFVVEAGAVPERFRVLYDPRNFASGSSIVLLDETGNETRAEYLGERGMQEFETLLSLYRKDRRSETKTRKKKLSASQTNLPEFFRDGPDLRSEEAPRKRPERGRSIPRRKLPGIFDELEGER